MIIIFDKQGKITASKILPDQPTAKVIDTAFKLMRNKGWSAAKAPTTRAARPAAPKQGSAFSAKKKAEPEPQKTSKGWSAAKAPTTSAARPSAPKQGSAFSTKKKATTTTTQPDSEMANKKKTSSKKKTNGSAAPKSNTGKSRKFQYSDSLLARMIETRKKRIAQAQSEKQQLEARRKGITTID